jgi:adenosine deaminase
MKCFDAQYNRLPKAELHCHLEGAIRTGTIIDVAREYRLERCGWSKSARESL